MTVTHLTLLVEEFWQMAGALQGENRFPALERVLSRGSKVNLEASTSNHLRFALFGIESTGDLPVAGLTHVSDRNERPTDNLYWLRGDPVTLWADMAQAIMTSHGFADLDPYERNEVENCVRIVLREENIDFHSDHPERWCIALNEPLEFHFTPLDQALGMDVAEALPGQTEARYWRRILNEIQVALHHCPVNVRRRQNGQAEINSVWFWGGGFIPDATPHHVFDTVYSNHPVSRGLAIINDCSIRNQNEPGRDLFERDGLSVLIDWVPVTDRARDEMLLLENLVASLLDEVASNRLSLTLLPGNGEGRIYSRTARRRFWRRSTSLAKILPALLAA